MADVFAEQEALNRRRQLMQALAQAHQQQPITGQYGLAQALAKIGTAYFQSKNEEKFKGEQSALNERYQAGLAEELMKLRSGMQGESAVKQFGAEPEARSQTVQAARAPDPQGALMGAMLSKYPEMQRVGAAMGPMLAKQGMTQEDYLKLSDYTPESRQAAARAGDLSLLQPRKEFMAVGDRVINKHDPSQVGADFRPQYGPVGELAQGPTGPIFGAVEKGTNKPLFAPGGTKVQVDMGQKGGVKFSEEIAKGQASTLEKSYEKAQMAQGAYAALAEAQQAYDAGVKSGAPADINLVVSKWGKALGLPDDPRIANTEAYRAAMARETMQLVKNLGAGTAISNADLEFADKASGGKITLDDAAMQRLMDISRAAIGSTFVQHQELLGRLSGRSGASPEDLQGYAIPFTFEAGDRLKFDEGNKRFLTLPGGGSGLPSKAKPNRVVVDW